MRLRSTPGKSGSLAWAPAGATPPRSGIAAIATNPRKSRRLMASLMTASCGFTASEVYFGPDHEKKGTRPCQERPCSRLTVLAASSLEGQTLDELDVLVKHAARAQN